MEESYWMPGDRIRRIPTPSSPPRPAANIRRSAGISDLLFAGTGSPGGGDYGRSSQSTAAGPTRRRRGILPPRLRGPMIVRRAHPRQTEGRRSEATALSTGWTCPGSGTGGSSTGNVPQRRPAKNVARPTRTSYHACPASDPGPSNSGRCGSQPWPLALHTLRSTNPRRWKRSQQVTKEAQVSTPRHLFDSGARPVERPKTEPSSKPSDRKAKSRKQRRAEAALAPVPVPETRRREPGTELEAESRIRSRRERTVDVRSGRLCAKAELRNYRMVNGVPS